MGADALRCVPGNGKRGDPMTTSISNEAKSRKSVLDATELRMAHGHEGGLRAATRRFCRASTPEERSRWASAATMMIDLGKEDHAASMAIIRDERARIFGSVVDR